MVMVVSVLPGGHPRCVPNKPTCWRDNGSTVTTQLLERVKRVRGEGGREAVTTTESIPITGKKQSSLSFNVRETNEAIFVTLFFSIPRDTNGIGRYTRFQIIPARVPSQTPLDFRSIRLDRSIQFWMTRRIRATRVPLFLIATLLPRASV